MVLILTRKPIKHRRLQQFVIQRMRSEGWLTFNPFQEDDSVEPVCFTKDGEVRSIDVMVDDFSKFMKAQED